MADGDASAKLMGYFIALERATPQALKAAVRAYLSGEVDGHDGRFVPTSAELARVVRREQEHLDRIAPRPQITHAARPEPSPEKRAAMRSKVEFLKWEGFPGIHALKEQPAATAPVSWMDKPLVEEVMAAPSPQLLAAEKRRKEQLRRQHGDPDDAA
jgi:hypothetical protein